MKMKLECRLAAAQDDQEPPLTADKTAITNFDKWGRGSRDGFVIVVAGGNGSRKVWGDQVFQTEQAAALTAALCVSSSYEVVAAKEVIHFGKNPVSHSYQRTVLLSDASEAHKGWYAIRTAPGFQRMAAPVAGHPEHRRGESIIERNLREEGIDVYMPAFWKELRKHRSRRLVERRLPLLVGYAFIRRDPGAGFTPVREIDGVNGIVTMGRDRGPIAFSERDIQTLMVAAFDRHQVYKFNRETALENARYGRRKHLNTELGRILPKGRSRTVSLRFHADACISGLDPAIKSKVLGIIEMLDGLEVDEQLDKYREAV